MIRNIFLIAILAMLAGKAVAQKDGCCDCPECGHKVCVVKAENKKVKKTVFAVEKKDICIPRFRFPWQPKPNVCGPQCDSNCDSSAGCGCASGRCGRVRTVKVLKKKSIECDKCGYKWEVMTVASQPCGGKGCAGKGQAVSETLVAFMV